MGGFEGIAASDGPAYAGGLLTGIVAMGFVMWVRRSRRGCIAKRWSASG